MIIGRHGEESLAGIIDGIKKFTSVKIIQAIRDNPQESRKELFLWLFERAGSRNKNNTTYQFWQQNNHPLELWNNEKVDHYLDYIHMNLMKAGIVVTPEHYRYSSAPNYVRAPEILLDVILIYKSVGGLM